jgi:hypothetical protein
MHELIINLHMHTVYSDGTGRHADIVNHALKCDIDVVIVTDHNVWVQGIEGYHKKGKKRLLMLVGEEVHDQSREPQKNHLLVFGADAEMATYAKKPQQLIDGVIQRGGLAFIAHPVDPALPLFNEDDISWVDWNVSRFTGIELWNGFSELKTVIHNRISALFYAFFPQFIATSPESETFSRWDNLLASGNKVVAIGGSDAHSLDKSMGPIHRTIFPYDFHFRTINTHLFTPEPLSGDLAKDQKMIYQALKDGHCFVGYDLPASTRGFRFTAQSSHGTAWMGDDLAIEGSATLQVLLPIETECSLIKDGALVKTWNNKKICTYITNEPGIYRIECTIPYLGKNRGWIYSNPIYLRPFNPVKNY